VKYVCVMPWVVWDWRHLCLQTCKIDVCEVDNSHTNRGVPRSWNMGIDEMRRTDADWLIVMSAAIRFGEAGGLDFIQQLNDHPEHRAISALDTYGWHLIAFSRETVETTGRFDENFWPGYLEDIDYAIRMYRVKPDAPWGAYECDVADAGMAHAIRKARIHHDAEANALYFLTKWGVPPGQEWHRYAQRPFSRPSHPIGYWPKSPHTQGEWDQPAEEAIR
jgi:hypothetical protein